jgi:hypothetical protein
MVVHIKSILEQISSEVFIMRDLNKAKSFIRDFVVDKNINDKDKQSILSATDECKTMVRLQTYLCNALLKYEGMGVAQLNKTAKQVAFESK